MRKQTLIIAALAVSFLLIASISMAQCPYSDSKSKTETTATKTSAAPAEGETVTLSVSNMTCDACVNHVTKALGAVDGVKDVTVSLKEGTAKVVYDAAKVNSETLSNAVVKAGYPAKLAVATDASAGKAAAGCAATCGAKKGCDPAACGMKTAKTDDNKKDDGGKK